MKETPFPFVVCAITHSGAMSALFVRHGPELLRAAPRESVLDAQAAAQPYDVLGAVVARDALPTRVLGPILLECGNFLATLIHERFLSVG